MHGRWQRKRQEDAELRQSLEVHAKGGGRRSLGWRHRSHFRNAALHVRLFWWFGFSILAMGGAAWAVFVAFGTGHGMSDETARLRRFAEGRFERVWQDAAERTDLAHAVAETVGGRVTLTDAKGTELLSTGALCTGDFPPRRFGAPGFTLAIAQEGAEVGRVHVCVDGRHGPGGKTFLLALGSAGLTLWMASMAVARRIGRPLRDLTRVTREIGEGNLKSRAHLGWRQPGELGTLAESINDMAQRIEQQLADERELVAAVSHEIRAPLSRLRILTEILRGKNVEHATLDKVEREIVEIDSLVGDLLASSRLDFSLVTFHSLDAAEIAREALDRAGLPESTLQATPSRRQFEGDATLLARALSNLLDNAARHAGGAVRMTVRDDGDNALVFAVEDEGPGFSADVLPRAFQAFERGNAQRRGSTSLGLGLALVRRIAEAHGGAAWAENLPERGARVAIRVARGPSKWRPGSSAPS